MFFWTRRLLASSTEVCQYLVFLVVCTAGLVNGTWFWIINGSMLLLLLDWPLDRSLFEQTAEPTGQATRLAIAVAAKLAHDALFLAGAFLFGGLARWIWSAEVSHATQLILAD
jgi:hypothetical protein